MNGHDVSNLPFIGKYGAPDYENNINNYLTDKLVRKAKKGDEQAYLEKLKELRAGGERNE